MGWEGFADVGIRIPLFNRNQGNIQAARSDSLLAEAEVRRLEMVIRSRFGSLFERYQTSRGEVETYRTEVLPRADQSYQLYLAKFKEMAAAYPQALIAQRTLFQASIRSRVPASPRSAASPVSGMAPRTAPTLIAAASTCTSASPRNRRTKTCAPRITPAGKP